MALRRLHQLRNVSRLLLVSVPIVAGLLVGSVFFHSDSALAQTDDDWPTSMHDVSRDNASNDTNISTANSPQLQPAWTYQTGGVIPATATVTGGVAYFGSWDGYEYALNATTGALIWKTYLGVTTYDPVCIPSTLGVSSPPTVQNGVVYVGGGNSDWYALNASTGAVEWDVYTGDSSAAGGNYNWSGPLIYNGYAYIGVSSLGDCPLVQGRLLQVNLTTHQLQNSLNLVPNGQIGGGIWTSPALDPSTGTIYTDTGTKNLPTQHDAQALLAVDAGTLEIKDHWELPNADAVLDSDFGTSTTLFTTPGGQKMVSAINKNGVVYAFKEGDLAAGPVWSDTIAEGGDCPTCGESSVSSGAYGDNQLYEAGESGVIGGQGYQGTVDAINPTTGQFVWQHAVSGPVVGTLAYANGEVFVSAGNYLEVLSAATGQTLFSYNMGSGLYAGPSISDGYVYDGTLSGEMYAFQVGSAPTTPPADPNCPSGWTCQNVGNVGAAGSETYNSSTNTWNIQTSGGGLSGPADSLRLITQPDTTDGNVQITGEVTAQQDGNVNAQGGVILRQSNSPGAAFYSVMVKPGGTLVIQDRTVQGGTASQVLSSATLGTLPVYLMIYKQADTISAATSTNGVTYTLVPGSTVSLVLPTTSVAGIATASGGNGATTSMTLSNVSIGEPSNAPVSASDGSTCPSSWTCQDIGNPNLVGGQTNSSGTWTVNAAGGDIWNNSDQFHYIYQTVPGDATVSAEVTSVQNTDDNAKAGVMLRGSNSATAAFYDAFVTPSGAIHVQYRDTSGWAANEQTTLTGSIPQYLEIARSGTTFSTYTSTNGTAWTYVPESTISLPNLSGSILGGIASTSHNTTELGMATFTNVAIGNTAPAPPDICPSSWTCQDIGFPTPSGDQIYSNGTWTVTSGGGDIWGNYDTFHMISQNLTGDASVSAEVSSQSNSGSWAKAGPMFRVSNDPQAPYYAIFVTPSEGIAVQYRSVEGGQTSQVTATGTAPIYLKVVRTGDSFTAYTSPDGNTWTAVPNSTSSIPALGGTALAGMAADSYNTINENTSVWNNVVLTGSTNSTGIPVPWQNTDIGSPTPAGSATYSNGTFTVNGGGNDIWGNTDQEQYVYQNITGDGMFIARVASQTDTDPWAKAGIMFKATTTSGSDYAAVMATPGNGVHMQADYNIDQDNQTGSVPGNVPVLLRIDRNGSLFTAYQSSDDGTNWVEVGQTVINMPLNVTIGMFVDAHDGSTSLGTATFNDVSFTPTGGGALPSPWQNTDIGTTGLPGSSSYADDTFYIKGAGSDIWGSDDDMQLMYQPLDGNGTIIAQLQSLDNTDSWAKAGVIVKASTTAGSNYAMLAATPGNELHMQYDFNGDISGSNYEYPNAWLELVRNGSVITTYTSPDGQNWTEVGTTIVTLPTDALIGLFVDAHDAGGALATAQFTNVSVTDSPVQTSQVSNSSNVSPLLQPKKQTTSSGK